MLWKPIKDYPGYQISSTGLIKRLARDGHTEKRYTYGNRSFTAKYPKVMKEKILKQRSPSMVSLYRNGVEFYENINKLVSIHFE